MTIFLKLHGTVRALTLSINKFTIMTLSTTASSVLMLGIALSTVMLNVVILSVVAPLTPMYGTSRIELL